MDERKFRQITQIAQRIFFGGGHNFYGVIFWLDFAWYMYLFHWISQTMSGPRTPLSYTSQSTCPWVLNISDLFE